MPLKIRVKPEGKIFAGGAVLKNVGTRPADLLILSDSPVLREDYMMNIDRSKESDTTNIYFLLQVLYLFRGKGKPLDTLVIDTIRKFKNLYPHFEQQVEEIVSLLETGEGFKALKICHKLLAQQQGVEAPASDPSATTETTSVSSSN